jgi:hypothetical protein
MYTKVTRTIKDITVFEKKKIMDIIDITAITLLLILPTGSVRIHNFTVQKIKMREKSSISSAIIKTIIHLKACILSAYFI